MSCLISIGISSAATVVTAWLVVMTLRLRRFYRQAIEELHDATGRALAAAEAWWEIGLGEQEPD